MQKWIMMSIHSWETDIEFLSFHLSKEGIVNGPLSKSKLFNAGLLNIHWLLSSIMHFLTKLLLFGLFWTHYPLSKTFFSSKILSELWIGNKRNVAFIFEKHAQFSQNEGIFEFWRPKYNCVARKIWKCICRKFEIRASLPFATGIRDFPRREQVGK